MKHSSFGFVHIQGKSMSDIKHIFLVGFYFGQRKRIGRKYITFLTFFTLLQSNSARLNVIRISCLPSLLRYWPVPAWHLGDGNLMERFLPVPGVYISNFRTFITFPKLFYLDFPFKLNVPINSRNLVPAFLLLQTIYLMSNNFTISTRGLKWLNSKWSASKPCSAASSCWKDKAQILNSLLPALFLESHHPFIPKSQCHFHALCSSIFSVTKEMFWC